MSFRKGKKWSRELHDFQYHLEHHLFELFIDLNRGKYSHSLYRQFTVADNKRRVISVSSIRDRILHRLVYDYLNALFDHRFLFDAWSCRKGKGLLKAIERAQHFLSSPDMFVWRADIQKFFDHVDHDILLSLLKRAVKDEQAFHLLNVIISSFEVIPGKGIPIGNLTSQIFANIYLHELDRYVKHILKPKAYLRYGDDFLIFHADLGKLKTMRTQVQDFLRFQLKLSLHARNDRILSSRNGIRFLGVILYPKGRRFTRRNRKRISHQMNHSNISSYYGLISQHEPKNLKQFFWKTSMLL